MVESIGARVMAKNDPASLRRAMPDRPPLLCRAAARQATHGSRRTIRDQKRQVMMPKGLLFAEASLDKPGVALGLSLSLTPLLFRLRGFRTHRGPVTGPDCRGTRGQSGRGNEIDAAGSFLRLSKNSCNKFR